MVETSEFKGGIIQGGAQAAFIKQDGDLYLVVINGYEKTYYKNDQIHKFIDYYKEQGK